MSSGEDYVRENITPVCPKCGAFMSFINFDGSEYTFICSSCGNDEFFDYGAFGESDYGEGDKLPYDEAEDIWLSSGMDEDYDFR